MGYRHRWLDGSAMAWPAAKAVCLGRNYLAHVQELGNVLPTRPVVFLKPGTSFRALEDGVILPEGLGDCHHELELTVLVGERLSKADAGAASRAIAGYGLGLDLTLRQLQDELKQQGQPWELAKAFDGAAVMTPFVAVAQLPNAQDCEIALRINGEDRQRARSSLMITSILDMLAFISQSISLEPGDVVFTGTPAGVAALASGDELELSLDGRWHFAGRVL
ncbi:MAG: fumarylacetoacetate hydrolase family protein [Gammaproteobacteria bacterium]|nr:fumarylacetoacetate hydrolase family protein [Gammaproteobacteria bacterium]